MRMLYTFEDFDFREEVRLELSLQVSRCHTLDSQQGAILLSVSNLLNLAANYLTLYNPLNTVAKLPFPMDSHLRYLPSLIPPRFNGFSGSYS